MALAKLLVAYRPVWILDEPTAALDVPRRRRCSRGWSRRIWQGGIVLAATHQPLGLEARGNCR